MSRPPRLSILKKLFRAIYEGLTIVDSCKQAGINRMTLWRWKTERPWIERHLIDLKMSRVEMVEDALFKSAIAGDVNAQKNFLINHKKGYRLGDPRDSRPSVVVQNTVTQNNTPQKDDDDEEELRQNADLIGKFALVDRYGSKAREGSVPAVCPEGQQREESNQRSDTSGDTGTHSGVQEAQ